MGDEMKNDFWRLFEKTGSVDDYLNYACTCEESQSFGREEGERCDEPDNGHRNGFIGHADWRL